MTDHKDSRGARAGLRVGGGFLGRASAIAQRHGGIVVAPTGGRDQYGMPAMRVIGASDGVSASTLGAIAKSAGWNILQAPSFAAALGGAESITRPMEEDWVLYACTRAKAAAVASVPIEIGTGEGDDFEALPATDPLVRLFKRPNRVTSWAMLMEAGTFSRIEHGEDWWLLLNAQGAAIQPGETPSQIVQVRPAIISIDKFDANGFPFEYSYTTAGTSQKRTVPAHAVLGFVEYDPYNNWRGLGAVDSIARELGVAYQVQRYVEAMAREGGDPGGFIILPDNAGSESIKQAQAEVDEEFGQAANRGRWKVLSGATFQPNTMSPKDMEFEKFMERHDWACAAVTGVPLVVLGILKDATYSNYENGLRAMWEGPNGVLTFLRSIEDRLNAFFFPSLRDAKYAACTLRFCVDEIAELQRDLSTRIESAARVASMAVGATFNEALELAGVRGRVEGGDVNLLESVEPDSEPEADPAEGGNDNSGGPGAGGDNSTGNADGEEEGSDSGDSSDDESKSALGSTVSRSSTTVAMESREERLAYADGVIKRVMAPGERAIQQAMRGHLRSYLRAQLARFRDFAKHGKAARGFEGMIKLGEADAAILEQLLLNKSEWETRLAKLMKPHLTRISSAALADMADELGGVSVGTQDPRVLKALSEQVLQLSEGVNSTLANKVRGALVETFKDQSSIGDLQVAVQEVLPELEGNVALAFRDRESRALAIARTESAHATNSARQIQMEEEGVTKTEWATAGDDAVRESHRALDGETRSLGADYAPNLAYPSDPRAPAGEVINCRCVLHPVD